MDEYEKDTFFRQEPVDGLEPWKWLKIDSGAWETSEEWEKTHKKEYYRNCKNFRVAIQAGGNQGVYPRLLAESFELVYTFEPDERNFYCLVNNCQKDNIIKIQGCLGSKMGLIDLGRPIPHNTGMIHMLNSPVKKYPIFTIDAFDFPVVDFIQLDIEGAETMAIVGGLNTIHRCRPVISVERTTPQIAQILKQLDYVEQITVKYDTIYYPNPNN